MGYLMSDSLKVIIYYKLDKDKPGHMIDVEFAFRSFNMADLQQISDRVPKEYKKNLIGFSSYSCSFLCSFFVESSFIISNSPFTTVLECENFITNLLRGYKYTVYSEDHTLLLNIENHHEIWDIKEVLGYPQIKANLHLEDTQNNSNNISLIMDATIHRELLVSFICRTSVITIDHDNMKMIFYSHVNKFSDEIKQDFMRLSNVLKYWLQMCGYKFYQSSIKEHNIKKILYYHEVIPVQYIGDIGAKDSDDKYILDQELRNKIKIIEAPTEAKTKETIQTVRCAPSF